MSTILIIVLLILLLGGGGYYGHSRYGGTGLGGILGLVLVIAVVVWLVGGLPIGGQQKTRLGRARKTKFHLSDALDATIAALV